MYELSHDKILSLQELLLALGLSFQYLESTTSHSTKEAMDTEPSKLWSSLHTLGLPLEDEPMEAEDAAIQEDININPNQAFSCDGACNDTFSSQFNLNRHKLQPICHNYLGPDIKCIKCEFCQGIFSSEEKKLAHLKKRKCPKQFKCRFCDTFFQLIMILFHMKSLHISHYCNYLYMYVTVTFLYSNNFRLFVCSISMASWFQLNKHGPDASTPRPCRLPTIGPSSPLLKEANKKAAPPRLLNLAEEIRFLHI